ncbi:MAG: zinc metalloprotease HtpX [Candidatus Buchananbacteria bacterium RIFCSPHIGHO2_02_FULL_40_13]|uniref:Protease HtpX homolog n=1 Tax=Candidatus Buchananbacteria bacterium RIFCSPLOWO2_01_FULL_39_33 TaxID=1797543 RepID=A0A1G1YI11_9BACT|nr:MAG: zinc metalloprotease HtpX [Candidatus Buchananbacteria bacterium RIFCSPHIGHO2_01_FULL_40_35]OGY50197.1 MAG: zinc metalloprotease HtpX [Candidatus Buchananbacteria bacterium RIFCSPHIGHO2_02_FULL_40_13]OGY51446.1 MAG: zinc metalloprotease HtpX [Candidatus Buchananbacteria bacterium RIFCSPLOWO2_01_FULL_39_33]
MYSQIDSNKRKTWFLMILFIILISALGYFLDYFTQAGNGLLIMAIIISLAMSLFSYFSGDKVALAVAGAKEIKSNDNPYVYKMVENLCITAGLPTPKVHLIEDKAINAFATGRDPKHASLAITTGAISKLANEELEGVIAHELSHIKNYDIRLMMIVIILVGIIALISDMFLRLTFDGGRRGNGKSGNPILLIIGLVLIILSPLIAQLIKLAVSRKREYLADAAGALLTRYPEGLAKALEKIANDPALLKRANGATAHLYISSPFKGTKKFLANTFSTHPPIEDRIAQLRQMA